MGVLSAAGSERILDLSSTGRRLADGARLARHEGLISLNGSAHLAAQS
jgi:hypothetical protein